MPTHTPTPIIPKRRYRKGKNKILPSRVAILVVCLLAILALVWFAISQIMGLFSEKKHKHTKGSAPWTIGLDAGHGGSDPGAQGIVSEVDMTEQTVQKLTEILQKDERFHVVLCREFGETVEKPSMRAIEGNKQGADLLLSIHGNSDTTGEGYGFECYPLPPGRELSEESLEFATYLAQSFEEMGARLRGTEGIRYAYYEGENEDVKVIREGSDQQVYDSQTFGFLEYAEVPAVLAEQCFITNQQDVDLFGQGEGIERAAKAYYHAICAFFEVEPLE